MKKSIKKVIIIITLGSTLIIILSLIISLLSPITLGAIYFRIKYPKHKADYLYLTPKKINIDANLNKSNECSDINIYGIKIKVPWEIKFSKDMGESTMYYMVNGLGVIVQDDVYEEFEFDILSYFDSETQKKITQLYGENIIRSEYLLKLKVLNTTPDKIPIFSLNNKEFVNVSLLSQKDMALVMDGREGIYNFDNKKIKGFIYGVPGESDSLCIEIYDNSEKHNYNIAILEKTNSLDEVIQIISSFEILENENNTSK